MSRQPIGKGDRVTIILNPAFPKERVILNALSKSSNKSGDIKELLYNYLIGNQLSNSYKTITNDYAINNNSITKECTMNDNSMVNDLSNNDNNTAYINVEKNQNLSNDFNINLDYMENKEIKIKHDQEDEIKQANNNALDFLKTF